MTVGLLVGVGVVAALIVAMAAAAALLAVATEADRERLSDAE